MLSLTRQERQVILFLITVALVGMGINFLGKRYSPIRAIVCSTQDFGKIDLNTADKDLLISIPGIGERLAERIMAYREKQVSFSNIEELKSIKGITDYRYEKIKDYLTVK